MTFGGAFQPKPFYDFKTDGHIKYFPEGQGQDCKDSDSKRTHLLIYAYIFLTFLCDSLSCSKEEEKDTNVPGTSTRKRKVKHFNFYLLMIYSATNTQKCICKYICKTEMKHGFIVV